MGERAQMLAKRYEQANDELIAVLAQCSAVQWQTLCVGEKWPVGVTAHHVAAMAGLNVDVLSIVARGEPWPAITMDMVHEANAAHAIEHSECAKDETIALLKHNCAAAAALIRQFGRRQSPALHEVWAHLSQTDALLMSLDRCRFHAAMARGLRRSASFALRPRSP